MMRLSSLLAVALILVLASVSVFAEVVNFETCPGTEDTCTIQEVRVNPCPQAEKRQACNIRRRRPTQISFDFVPKFNADQLHITLGWVKSEEEELMLPTLERDACKSTTCPAQNGVKQTYTTDVPIEAKFPLSPYTIRWNIKDPASGKRCCFTIDIKVVR
ncbi:MD-2-related lipid-recognition protein-like [Drosophila kikkawai]|uniref:MD-2-related lipid-recognition protein-like n=1 Tax=Drosophila kikkawai TaxID=30033 RepID=A0A6P4HYQ9_DROKI|nr:MD-2-related lipid-recognition protein-like [Drosophila kikkawai]KAH8308029.1 hypothetical protein KR059_004634 [Drosophila kikkawai]